MGNYDLPPGLNDKIIEYCYKKMEAINQKFLLDNKIRPNLFMEVMYDQAVKNMHQRGDFDVDETELQQIFVFVKHTENILVGFMEGRNELVGIRDDENLVFKVKRQIEY